MIILIIGLYVALLMGFIYVKTYIKYNDELIDDIHDRLNSLIKIVNSTEDNESQEQQDNKPLSQERVLEISNNIIFYNLHDIILNEKNHNLIFEDFLVENKFCNTNELNLIYSEPIILKSFEMNFFKCFDKIYDSKDFFNKVDENGIGFYYDLYNKLCESSIHYTVITSESNLYCVIDVFKLKYMKMLLDSYVDQNYYFKKKINNNNFNA